MDADVYKALESSVKDALEMSTMASSLGISDGTSVAGSALNLDDSSAEKRMRRKADNLCRSLTELCIALCEVQQASSPILQAKLAARRGSQDVVPAMPSPEVEYSPLYNLEERRQRLDRGQSSSLRNSNRPVDSTSLRLTSSTYQRTTPRYLESRDSPSVDADPTRRPLNRTYTSLLQHEPPHPSTYDQYDDADEDFEHDPTVRIPSRAMTTTELDSRRQTSTGDSPRALRKFSRDYTSRHPLPDAPSLSFKQPPQPSQQNSSAYMRNQSAASFAPRERAAYAGDGLSPNIGSGGVDDAVSVSGRSWAGSGRSGKLPPSAAASLAQRIEERRAQRRLAAEGAGGVG